MSYLNPPRLHFKGEFTADPSTRNNTPTNFDPEEDLENVWNPKGSHWLSFENCTVTKVLDTKGEPVPILGGGSVESTNKPAFAKIVDIDVGAQGASQIWGLEVKVSIDGASFQGQMQVASFRDLFGNRAPGGFSQGIGAVYQSILKGVTFTPAESFLASLFGRNVVINPRRPAIFRSKFLSIKFVLYAYNMTSSNPKFTRGKVVGTIGRHLGNPTHFIARRRLTDGSDRSDLYGPAHFQVDGPRRKVTFDFGNSFRESEPGGERVPRGTMEAVIAGDAGEIVLGTIDYSKSHYETTAGIEELTISAEQVTLLKTRPLKIKVPREELLTERPQGSYVDASAIGFRLNPGQTKTVTFYATVFGVPKSGQPLTLKRSSGSPVSALSFPTNVRTNSFGKAIVKFTASDPGHPRDFIDGQLYHITFYWGSDSSDKRGDIYVKVFDAHPVPRSPSWSDVQTIFEQYARLYPYMKDIVDLRNLSDVRANLDRIKTTLSYPESDPRYMPVTRDLSRDKKKMLLKWLDAGAP